MLTCRHFCCTNATNLLQNRRHDNRAAQRQSVRSSRSETTDFTFDEGDAPADGDQRSILIRRDVTFSE